MSVCVSALEDKHVGVFPSTSLKCGAAESVVSIMHVSSQLCVCLGVSVCCRCVTFSVLYSNTFSEALKQLSVPFVTYRKTCQHLASGAHRSQERMLYL